MVTKRSRSPSPTLPLHLYTSLPTTGTPAAASVSSTSPRRTTTTRRGGDRDRISAIDAREATLLDPWPHTSGSGDSPDRIHLVPWTGRVPRRAADPGRPTREDDNVDEDEGEYREVLTDRYDILHLLPSVPALSAAIVNNNNNNSDNDPACTGARSGFDDLPSDHEELFFLNSSADRADVARRKKRRRLELERDARVRERLHQDGDADRNGSAAANQGGNGDGDGDLPPAEVRELMARLHATLSRSGNPALLELRILAHHGSDPRFASFLRREGPWRTWWEDLRAGRSRNDDGGGGSGAASDGERTGRAEPEGNGAAATATGLGGLAAYGSDSDDASSAGSADGGGSVEVSRAADDDLGLAGPTAAAGPPCAQTSPERGRTADEFPPPPPPTTTTNNGPAGGAVSDGTRTTREEPLAREDGDTDAEQRDRKEARAAKAREWARKRRAAREAPREPAEASDRVLLPPQDETGVEK